MAGNPKKSNFVSDKRFEEVSLEYLRTKTKILKELGTKEIVKDRSRQVQGIDIICDIPRTFPKSFFKLKQKKVDIKACAKLIPTFCFEFAGNKTSKNKGWIANSELLTDYYLLVYHEIENGSRSYTVNKARITVDNVIYTKALLIKKAKICKYINEYIKDVSYDYIITTIREMSKDKKSIARYQLDENGKIIEKRKDDNKIYFSVSKQLGEQPINIILRREELEKLAEHIWEVDKNGNSYLP